MEQYDGLFPAAYVDSSSLPMVPNGAYSPRTGTAAHQGERPRARRRRRRAARCGGDGELDGPGGDPKKRRLSDEQVEMLELSFREDRKLETDRKMHLAAELGLDPKQVAVWFQNRRARHKCKLLEEEFSKLKQAHDAAILHKCHLENEVMRLKQRLVLAEEELTRFRSAGSQRSHAVSGDGMGRAVVCSGRSPSSSFATGTCHQPGVVDVGDPLGDDHDDQQLEWFSLYAWTDVSELSDQ